MASSVSPSSGPGAETAHLRLLSSSDLHMRILPYDYLADREICAGGIALAAAEARQAAAEAGTTLWFDVGDAFEGSPVDEVLATGPQPHPMATALGAAGVDAATLGNHDFNFGLDAARRFAEACPMPVVLANLVRRLGATPLDDTPFLAPFTVLTRQLSCGEGPPRPIRIGVLGLTPPQTLAWDADKLAGRLEARDMVEAARAWVPEIRRSADIVVALCHSGIARARPGWRAENAAVAVAEVPGVDAVMAGHTHRLFPDPGFEVAPDAIGVVDPRNGRLHGVPATMPGHGGRHLGMIDLMLAHQGQGGWRVAHSSARLLKVSRTTPDPGVADATRPYHQAALAEIRQPIGRSATPLHSYFAHICDAPSVRVVQAAQAAAVRAGLAGRPEADLPVLSAASPLRAGGLSGPSHYTDIPPGILARRHVADLYLYPNALLAVPISGADLRLWLERAASVFLQVSPGARDAPLVDPAQPSYSFDSISGLTYQIDLSVPAAFEADGAPTGAAPARIANLRHAGRPVAPDDRFMLATNSYRLAGRIGYPVLSDPPLVIAGGMSCREAVARFIANGGAELPLPPPSWSFVRIEDATARVETGPGARALEGPQMLKRALSGPLGTTRSGFDVYRLDLARVPASD